MRLTLFFTSFLFLASTLSAQDYPPVSFDSVALKYSKTITAEDIREHLEVLASDEYEGRETGQPGQKMAAKYIASHYSQLNLKAPVNGTSYMQQFPVVTKNLESASIKINGKEFEFLTDFYAFPGSNSSIEIESKEVVFLGYGIEAENYNDYREIDVKDKVVLFFYGDPKNKKGISHVTGKEEQSAWGKQWRKKLKHAYKKGAKAALVVVEDVPGRVERFDHYITGGSMKLEQDVKDPEFPHNAYISYDMANWLLGESKKTMEDYRSKIDKKGKFTPFSISCRLNMGITAPYETLETENVLGMIEGTQMPEEVIILTAHYDHLGVKGEDIYNGADDDGTGVSAILDIAEAFTQAAKEGHRPLRSVVFMPVSAEEKGLLGSKYYTENPVFPIENTVTNLNIDMIGRVDEKHEADSNYVYLIGADRISKELHYVNEEVGKLYTSLDLDYTFNERDDPNRFYYRSDHYNFAQKGVPVIFYFSGVHEDYHKPTDTIDKIMFNKTADIARYIFLTTWTLANREDRLQLDGEDASKVER